MSAQPMSQITVTSPRSRRCTGCGKTFIPVRRDGCFCSSACCQFAYRARHGAGMYKNHPCMACGEMFQSLRWDAQYCSPACRKRVSRTRKKMLSEVKGNYDNTHKI